MNVPTPILLNALLSALLPQEPQERQKPQRVLLPVPLTYVCRRGDRKIEVDGSLVDWPALPALDLSNERQLSGTAPGAWRGRGDLAAVAFLMWDEEALWFACKVSDDWHRALDKQTLQHELPVADSIVLTFDPDRNTRKLGRNRERLDDAEFWLFEENSHVVLKVDRMSGDATQVDGSREVVSHDQQEGITTYEARIPWANILPPDRKPAAGVVFDLQVVVNDYDEISDPLPQTRAGWTFGCSEVIDPGLFGSAMLLDKTELGPDLPPFPPKAGPAPLEYDYWEKIAHGLRDHPPAVHDGRQAPEACGGTARLAVLEQLDRELADYPRLDYVELQARMQRRMTREVAGSCLHGVPSFWLQGVRDLELELTAKDATDPPAGTVRLYRLPQSGWAVRAPSLGDSFMVDPVGMAVHERLWGLANFVVLTQPLDMTRRSDQLLMRMYASKERRPFLTHIAFHVPLVDMKDFALVEPGKLLTPISGVEVTPLGHARADGAVPYSFGYRVDYAHGPSLMFSGPAVRADAVEGGKHCALLVLSPRNPEALEIARAVKPDLVVVDDVFLCNSLPNVVRVSLANAHALQKALLPIPSLLLAPGEHCEIPNRK